MNNIVDALRVFGKKLTGTDVTSDTIANSIGEIAENYTGSGSGGSSLPEVTLDDNGSVLEVVGGEWAKGKSPSPVIIDLGYIQNSQWDASEGACIANMGSRLTLSYQQIADLLGYNSYTKKYKNPDKVIIRVEFNVKPSVNPSGGTQKSQRIAMYARCNATTGVSTMNEIRFTSGDQFIGYWISESDVKYGMCFRCDVSIKAAAGSFTDADVRVFEAKIPYAKIPS